MSTYKVRNIREGGRLGNWIKYWEDATGLRAGSCHRVDCLTNHSDAIDGAHVQLVGSTDRRWYIVPLCHTCNCQFGEEFHVHGPLVAANDSRTILP